MSTSAVRAVVSRAGAGAGAAGARPPARGRPASCSSASSASAVDPSDARFTTELEVLAVLAPRRDVGGLMRVLKKHTIARPRVRGVVHLDDARPEDSDAVGGRGGGGESLILLDEHTCAPDAPLDALPASVARAVGIPIPPSSADPSGAPVSARDAPSIPGSPRLVTHRLVLGYDDLEADEALSRLLPPGVTVPTGFETAGTIAHLNLRAEHDPHKSVIARVLLDKLPQIRTVVNKIAETGGPYRTFAMEVLAGEGEGGDGPLETEVNENGLTYALDFRAVYWNSRLGTERARLVDSFGPEDVVLDLCCGVGPIALPAARVARAVYANDLNPTSVEYLRANEKRNNAKRGALLAGITCGDARDCVAARASAVPIPAGDGDGDGDGETSGDGNVDFSSSPSPGLRFTQVVLNLPQGSLGLLDCFVGAFDRRAWPPGTLPRINAYAFSKSDDPEADVGAAAAAALGLEPRAEALGDHTRYRRVRLVAPGKYMMLVSFPLPEEAAYSSAETR
jgi:tRNA (guanine37-N1)-methyltransferase